MQSESNKMKYPSTTKLNWLESIRLISSLRLFCIFALIYVISTLTFALLYYYHVPLANQHLNQIIKTENEKIEKKVKPEFETKIIFLDSVYFSVVTGTTLGFGDYSPKNPIGKIIVIFHVLLATIFFALIVSFIFLKLLHPKETLIFSNIIVYDKTTSSLIFRIINVSRSKLINPEIRVVIGKHASKHGMSNHQLIGKIDDAPVLGNHDSQFTLFDHNSEILKQINIAREFNKDKTTYDGKSRFRIKISVTGTYAFSQYSHYQKYSEENVVFGNGFMRIEYSPKFHKRRRKYSGIEGFWLKFNSISED